jgi:hypothetical protein
VQADGQLGVEKVGDRLARGSKDVERATHAADGEEPAVLGVLCGSKTDDQRTQLRMRAGSRRGVRLHWARRIDSHRPV